MSPETPQPSSRLRGTLIKHLADKAAAASLAQSGEAASPHRRMRIGCFDIELDPDSRDIVLESGAHGVAGATIKGFWHLSSGAIDRFTNDKGTGKASNLGPGTYIGYGALSGDRIRQLESDGHIRHELVVHGNLLLVPLEEQDNASWEVAERTVGDSGLDAVARMAPSKRINALLRDHTLEGIKFDGFVFYSETNGNAEGVVFYPEQVLDIAGRHVVGG